MCNKTNKTNVGPNKNGSRWPCHIQKTAGAAAGLSEKMILPSGNLTWLLKIAIYSGFTH